MAEFGGNIPPTSSLQQPQKNYTQLLSLATESPPGGPGHPHFTMPVHTVSGYGLPYHPNWHTPLLSPETASSDMERQSDNPMPADNQDDELGSSVSAQPKQKEFTGLITIVPSKKELMGEHASYHQSIKADEAERRLKMFSRNCYLTRYSKTRECYVLSVYRKQRPNDVIEHFQIIVEKNGKHKINDDEDFETISALLEYYETHRISPAFPTIGKCYTEDEFNKQLNLIEEEAEQEEKKINQLEAEHIRLLEEAREKERELKEAKEAAEAAERQRQQDLQAAKEQKRRELQAEQQKQLELQEALRRAEAQRQQDIQAQKREAEAQKREAEAQKAVVEAQKAVAEAQKREAEAQKAVAEAQKREAERQKAVVMAEKAEVERQKTALEAELRNKLCTIL